MNLTVAAMKGGVGKTTTAIHVAAALQRLAPTLLVDADPIRSAFAWARRGTLPFEVMDDRMALKFVRHYEHIVLDTPARPTEDELSSLAEGCDLLIIPTPPDALAIDALLKTVRPLRALPSDRYRILLTMTPPPPSREAAEAREALEAQGLRLFAAGVDRLAAFKKAALEGVLVQEVRDARAHRGAAAYEAVGREILANG